MASEPESIFKFLAESEPESIIFKYPELKPESEAIFYSASDYFLLHYPVASTEQQLVDVDMRYIYN